MKHLIGVFLFSGLLFAQSPEPKLVQPPIPMAPAPVQIGNTEIAVMIASDRIEIERLKLDLANMTKAFLDLRAKYLEVLKKIPSASDTEIKSSER